MKAQLSEQSIELNDIEQPTMRSLKKPAGAPTNYGSTEFDIQDKLKKSWLRRNWCWAVRVVLAIVGITIPLIMFLQPCQDEIRTFLITVEEPREITKIENTTRVENKTDLVYWNKTITVTKTIQELRQVNETVNVTVVEEVPTTIRQPVDLYFIFDASGTMSTEIPTKWYRSIQASLAIVDAFRSVDYVSLSMGASLFARRAKTIADFTSDLDGFRDVIEGFETYSILDNNNLPEWDIAFSTRYEPALEQYVDDWASGGNPQAKPIVVFISDGEPQAPYEGTDLARAIRGTGAGGVPPLAEFVDHPGGDPLIMGILVGTEQEACTDDNGRSVDCLYLASSCDDVVSFKKWKKDTDTCELYAQYADFDEFLDSAQSVAEKLKERVEFVKKNVTRQVEQTIFKNVLVNITVNATEEVVDRITYNVTLFNITEYNITTIVEMEKLTQQKQEVECVKTPWLGFLALLLPFLCVAIVPLFINRQKRYIKRTKKQVQLKQPLMPTPKEPTPPASPSPVPNPPGYVKPKFKWRIKATDKKMQSGMPMPVNFGAKAASSSAPKEVELKRVQAKVDPWDDGNSGLKWEDEDGYINEVIEEERTLEEFTEDVIKEAADVVRETFCCCFGSVKKTSESVQGVLDLETGRNSNKNKEVEEF